MSVWHDFIRRLEQDLAECRSDLELLESGRMQNRERRDGGAWVDTTQRELDWHKKTIGMYEGLIRKLRGGTRRIGKGREQDYRIAVTHDDFTRRPHVVTRHMSGANQLGLRPH